jgi:hypothetical protein
MLQEPGNGHAVAGPGSNGLAVNGNDDFANASQRLMQVAGGNRGPVRPKAFFA